MHSITVLSINERRIIAIFQTKKKMALAGMNVMNILSEQLKLKQLEQDTLLDITTAINSNETAEKLFGLFTDTLSKQLQVDRFMLLAYDGEWNVAAEHHAAGDELIDVERDLLPFTRLTYLSDLPARESELLRTYDIIVPVYHKSQPLAYLLMTEPLTSQLEELEDKIKFAQTVVNIIIVAIENKRLFKREKEQEALQRELELAAQVQSMLIPDKLPADENVVVDALYLPHITVGGDYYDFMYLDDDEFFFCIADISGKGMGAALLMANFQGQLRELVKRNHPTIDEFLQDLNKGVLHNTKGEKFITMFLGKYNSNTRILKYVNAGHNPPVLVTNKGQRLLDSGCTILGIFDELPSVRMGQVPIVDDTTIMCYTDGLTDLYDEKNGATFTTDDITRLLKDNLKDDVEEINRKLAAEIIPFRTENGFGDDITIMTLRISGRR